MVVELNLGNLGNAKCLDTDSVIDTVTVLLLFGSKLENGWHSNDSMLFGL